MGPTLIPDKQQTIEERATQLYKGNMLSHANRCRLYGASSTEVDWSI